MKVNLGQTLQERKDSGSTEQMFDSGGEGLGHI